MNTNDPRTQERLDAIQARADIIRARVNAMAVNDSRSGYPWPDPTDERVKELEKENAELRARLTVDNGMVERAARAYYDRSVKGLDESYYMQWDQLARTRPGGAQRYRDLASVVLNAALGTEKEES